MTKTIWQGNLETLQSWIQSQHGRPYHRSELARQAAALGIGERSFGYTSAALNYAGIHTNVGQALGYWAGTGKVLDGVEINRLYDLHQVKKGSTVASRDEKMAKMPACPVCTTIHAGEC